jgi:hypothetical protein
MHVAAWLDEWNKLRKQGKGLIRTLESDGSTSKKRSKLPHSKIDALKSQLTNSSPPLS